MIMRLKFFNDNPNVVVIVAPGYEFFSAKFIKFPLKVMEGN